MIIMLQGQIVALQEKTSANLQIGFVKEKLCLLQSMHTSLLDMLQAAQL